MSTAGGLTTFEFWRNHVTFGFAALAALGSLAAATGSFRSISLLAVLGFSETAGVVAGIALAGLYLFLGARPQFAVWWWELAILHRLLLAVAGGYLVLTGVSAAAFTLVANVFIAALLIASYLVGGGHRLLLD